MILHEPIFPISPLYLLPYTSGGSWPGSIIHAKGQPIGKVYVHTDLSVGHPLDHILLCPLTMLKQKTSFYFTSPCQWGTQIALPTFFNHYNTIWLDCYSVPPHVLYYVTESCPTISNNEPTVILPTDLNVSLDKICLWLSPTSCSYLLRNIEVYVNNFI